MSLSIIQLRKRLKNVTRRSERYLKKYNEIKSYTSALEEVVLKDSLLTPTQLRSKLKRRIRLERQAVKS